MLPRAAMDVAATVRERGTPPDPHQPGGNGPSGGGGSLTPRPLLGGEADQRTWSATRDWGTIRLALANVPSVFHGARQLLDHPPRRGSMSAVETCWRQSPGPFHGKASRWCAIAMATCSDLESGRETQIVVDGLGQPPLAWSGGR